MTEKIPQFPHNDEQVKVIALLGYTGVGKTSLITAAYFENLMYGKDAFTQRFFQRIEDEIRNYGEIPLTIGDASTLSFIESISRSEFTIQDFSGEHIKLERKEESNYQDLIARADDAHALICLLSAANFYRSTQIHEEVDAIQTFVNKLRGLGTRIPVVVVLSKCDVVPRFYINFPVLKSISTFISALPFLALPPKRGLELTRRRFPGVFSGLDFKGKGPRTVFLGVALPRLAHLKAWKWPKGFQWLGKILRKMLIDPKYIFSKNFQLPEIFDFCFQAFQLSTLRNLLIRNHKDQEYCPKLLKQFEYDLIENNPFGKDFHFKEYFDRIDSDTQALIDEMEQEIATLNSDSERLLSHEKDLAQNLRDWLEAIAIRIRKFDKPWSEGVRKNLEILRHETLRRLCERLKEWINDSLAQSDATTFYRLLDILRLRRDIGQFDIWAHEKIVLPEVDSFQQKLLEYFINVSLSREELVLSVFEEDRNKYLEVLTITPPQEIKMLEDLIAKGIELQKNLLKQEPGSGNWNLQILEPFAIFEQAWLELARFFTLQSECGFRRSIEKKVLASLRQEAEQFKSLGQLLDWTGEVEQLLLTTAAKQTLPSIVEVASSQAQSLLHQEMAEIRARGQKWQGAGNSLPARIKEWHQESEQRRSYLQMIGGTKGAESLDNLYHEVFASVRDFVAENAKKLLTDHEQTLQRQEGDRAIFLRTVEELHIYRGIEELNVLSKYGFALSNTDELEKALFHNLVSITLAHSNITAALYQEDRTRYLACLRGSPSPYLQSLDALVDACENLQTKGKEGVTVPIAQWQEQIFNPMQNFHHNWLELSGRLNISAEVTVRKEAELLAVRSLKDQAENLPLRSLRDRVAQLSPLLQLSAQRNTLDELLQRSEQEIRNRFQGELEEFVVQARALSTAAENLPQPKIDVDECWLKFTGSLEALALSAQKFPHTELAFDDNIENILQQAPEQVADAILKWSKALQQRRLLSYEDCRRLEHAVGRIQAIFHRPQAFLALEQRVRHHLQRFRRRRKNIRRLLGAIACLLVIAAGCWGFCGYMHKRVDDVVAFEERRFEQHQEIARRWEALLAYPDFLIPYTSQQIIQKMAFHDHLHWLEQTHKQLNENTSAELLSTWQHKLEKLLMTKPEKRVQYRAQQLLVETRSLQLLRIVRDNSLSRELLDVQVKNLRTLREQITGYAFLRFPMLAKLIHQYQAQATSSITKEPK